MRSFAHARRQQMRFIGMSSSAASVLSKRNSDGHVWIYESQQSNTFPSTLSALKEKSSSVVKCALPKMTPPIPIENRLYKSNSSLKELSDAKANFYKDQFKQRVSRLDAKRTQKRRVQSPFSERKVDITIYFPEKHVDNQDAKLKGVCLHLHGGGWLWGDSYYQVAHRCLEMASHLNAAVVSVEYSLLHHEIFDPVGDVIAALEWIEFSGADELGSDRVFVGSGESSGAHLLMSAMLHRRDDANQKLPIKDMWKCLNLVYGVYDLAGTPSIRYDGDKSSPLCGNDLLWLCDLYCVRVKAESQMKTSPLYADMSCMPPALFSVGTADPLLDDSLLLAEKYQSNNNDLKIALYEYGEHGIGHFGVQEDEAMGEQARRYTLDFLKECLEK